MLPLITGWTNAVIPSPEDTVTNGGLITSYLFPPFNTLTDSNGP